MIVLLRELGVFEEKQVSQRTTKIFWASSRPTRLAVLAGFGDTDGWRLAVRGMSHTRRRALVLVWASSVDAPLLEAFVSNSCLLLWQTVSVENKRGKIRGNASDESRG